MVNSEIVKVTDESVQKEIYINTEVLEIVNSENFYYFTIKYP
jgi:hypothetical protein